MRDNNFDDKSLEIEREPFPNHNLNNDDDNNETEPEEEEEVSTNNFQLNTPRSSIKFGVGTFHLVVESLEENLENTYLIWMSLFDEVKPFLSSTKPNNGRDYY